MPRYFRGFVDAAGVSGLFSRHACREKPATAGQRWPARLSAPGAAISTCSCDCKRAAVRRTTVGRPTTPGKAATAGELGGLVGKSETKGKREKRNFCE